MALRNNAVVRKSLALANQLPRGVRRLTSREGEFQTNPPILCNSFPKSGTHLLDQVLTGMAEPVNFGSFIASMPSVTYRQRSVASISRSVAAIVPGELVRAHLQYDPRYPPLLSRRNVVHFFIYRDPRDVVISEALYLAEMNRWHRLHRHFAALEAVGSRIMFAILGNQFRRTSFDYPDIGQRYRRYSPWIAQPETFSLRFEDLRGEGRDQSLRSMAEFLSTRIPDAADADDLAKKASKSIDPRRSHTFRRGAVGQWSELFDDEHREAMKRVAGNLLVELGYEADRDW